MLAKIQVQKEAISLRKKGLSDSEIHKLLPAAKGSLSLWLHHIVLTDKQKRRLKDISQGAGARARRNQRLLKQSALEQEVSAEITDLLKIPFFLFGLALYWAEGTKQKPWRIATKLQFCSVFGLRGVGA